MRAIASPYPSVLEEELAASLAALKEKDPFAPVLIVAPSILLLDRLKRVLSRKLGAALGVEFLYHRRVAEAAIGHCGDPEPASLSLAGPGLLQRLLSGVIRNGDSPLRGYGRVWPGTVRALLSTFRDFRDAGVHPSMLDEQRCDSPGRETQEDLFAIYGEYVAALGRLGAQGLTDAAGLVGAALPHAPKWARRFSQVYHYGAYDLVGIHADLMRAIARGAPITWLVPAHPEAPAFEMGRKFLARLGDDMDISWAGAQARPGPPADRATALFSDDTVFDTPMEQGALDLFHAQGAQAEADHAVRLAMKAVAEENIAPEDIAIVARDITTYAPRVLPTLVASGLAARVPAVRSLAAEPGVHALIFLLRTLMGDLERQTLIDLARSPAFRGEALLAEKNLPYCPDVWDRWSRGAGVIRGRAMWADGISAWLADRRRIRGRLRSEPDTGTEDRRLAGLICLLDLLSDARDQWLKTPARWEDQAAAIGELAARFLTPFAGEPTGGANEVIAILGDLARLGAVAATVPIESASPENAFAFVHDAVSSAFLTPGEGAPGGVRVIDLMQARCVPFKRAILIGFNQGVVPRKLSEDPFLPDDIRIRLRETLDRPVPVKLEGDVEERILLAMLAAGTEGRLSIGWQRADADGKACSPSLALREILRIREGEPAIDRVLRNDSAVLRLRSHPVEALKQVLDLDGRLSGDQALVGAGLALAGCGSSPGEAVRALRDALGRADERARHGLALLERVEDWRSEDLTCDGIVGPEAAALLPSPLSVSALQTLGRCPLAFFFGRVLGIREMDTVGEEGDIEAYEMGELVHLLLERTYAQLSAENLFAGGEEALVARGLALIGELWDEVFEGPRTRIERFLPLLWELESSLWRGEVEAFVAADLGRLSTEGGRPLALEKIIEEDIGIAPGIDGGALRVHARLDRVMGFGDGTIRLGDYKTAGNPANRLDLKEMLRGVELQMPLYLMAAESWLRAEGKRGADVAGEILALGPSVDDEKRYTETGPCAVDPVKFNKIRAGIEETLAVLIETARAGNFPMNPSRRCGYCPYRRGCRRTHPPSNARLQAEPSLDRLRRVRAKIQKKPMLSDLSAPAARGKGR